MDIACVLHIHTEFFVLFCFVLSCFVLLKKDLVSCRGHIPLIRALGRQIQVDPWEFKASVVYTVQLKLYNWGSVSNNKQKSHLSIFTFKKKPRCWDLSEELTRRDQKRSEEGLSLPASQIHTYIRLFFLFFFPLPVCFFKAFPVFFFFFF